VRGRRRTPHTRRRTHSRAGLRVHCLPVPWRVLTPPPPLPRLRMQAKAV
jgi:hypothetical protein